MPADIEAAWLSLRTQLVAHRPDPSAQALGDTETPTPVCLLTGFLGAGKSFLLADLLTNPPDDTRIKAIVNDVGALEFDPTLIESENDVRVELTNGCGCCERTSELADALAALADDPTCDLIVLEASGAADPLAVAQVIAANPSLRLDRIVAVVSAAQLTAATVHQPALPETKLPETKLPETKLPETALLEPMASITDRQIDSAHCVIVSACDLVDHHAATAAVERAAQLAPGRTVTRSSRQAPATHVLLPGAPRGARPAPANAGAIHRELAVVTLEQRHEPTMSELRSVLEASRPGLVRAKGRLVIEGQRYLVQLTPQSIDIMDAPPGPTGLTVIAVEGSDAQRLIDLIDPTAAVSPSTKPMPPQKAVLT